jgi:polyisoprenoid-binding protein YceI
MIVRYRLEPGQSRFTVQAFAAGMLSFLGHNPTFAVRDVRGEMRLDHSTVGGSLLVVVRADSLELLDQIKPADRQEIEQRMRQEELETTKFQEIRFEAESLSGREAEGNQYRLQLRGRLELHGVTRPVELGAQLRVFRDGARVTGECPLSLSEYGIRPVTALAGAIKLKDQLRVAFDLAFLVGENE